MLEYAALLLAFASLGTSGYLGYRLRVLREDLRYVHRQARLASDRFEEESAALRAELAKRPAAAAAPGKPRRFSPLMTIQDAINLHEGTKGVLASMHIGGCSSCSASSSETLEQAAKGHRVDLEEMLEKLEALYEGEAVPSLAALAQQPDPALARAEKFLPPAVGGRVMLGVLPPA